MLTQERLKELLRYDPETGHFGWIKNRIRTDRVGLRAGSLVDTGRRKIGIDGVPYLEHHLACLYMTGRLPNGEMDHINRDPADNRWVNLRCVTRHQNMWNTGPTRKNVCGIKGVHQRKENKKFRAAMRIKGKQTVIGDFDTLEEARDAYDAAVVEHRGEFGVTNRDLATQRGLP